MRRLFLPLLAIVAVATDASAVEFKFAPADGLECDQHLKTSSVTTLQDVEAAPRREQSSESVTHLTYEKSAGGYRVKARTVSGEMKRDGKVMDDPVTKLLVGSEVVLLVDSNGTVTGVEGYDKLVERMLAAATPETRAGLEKMVTAKSMNDREAAEWNGRVSGFVGKKVEAGDVWEGQQEMPTPNGSIKFTTLTRFSKIEETAGRPMVTIHFTYAGDADTAREAMKRLQEGLAAMGKEVPVTAGAARIEGDGERLVDASTMNIARERIHRVIHLPMEVPGAGKATMVRDENHEYVLDCRK